MFQVSREDVQERIIKNKTLLNATEATIQNKQLARLLHKLRMRIEYDKMLLFHDTELRKMAVVGTKRMRLAGVAETHSSPGRPGSPAEKLAASQQQRQIAVTLRQYSLGYAAILRLLREMEGTEIDRLNACEEGVETGDISDDESEEEFSQDADYFPVISNLPIPKQIKIANLNSSRPRSPSSPGKTYAYILLISLPIQTFTV